MGRNYLEDLRNGNLKFFYPSGQGLDLINLFRAISYRYTLGFDFAPEALTDIKNGMQWKSEIAHLSIFLKENKRNIGIDLKTQPKWQNGDILFIDDLLKQLFVEAQDPKLAIEDLKNLGIFELLNGPVDFVNLELQAKKLRVQARAAERMVASDRPIQPQNPDDMRLLKLANIDLNGIKGIGVALNTDRNELILSDNNGKNIAIISTDEAMKGEGFELSKLIGAKDDYRVKFLNEGRNQWLITRNSETIETFEQPASSPLKVAYDRSEILVKALGAVVGEFTVAGKYNVSLVRDTFDMDQITININDKPAGVFKFYIIPNAQEVALGNIALKGEFRGEGIASEIYRRVASLARAELAYIQWFRTYDVTNPAILSIHENVFGNAEVGVGKEWMVLANAKQQYPELFMVII